MTIEKRLENLENLVNALSKKIDNNKYYTDADINGNRKSVSDITPYTETKTAGIQDTVCVFEGHYQHGVISAMVVTDRGTLVPNTIEWSDDNITVRFDELTETATVTISIQ